jgi:hypothetical protein
MSIFPLHFGDEIMRSPTLSSEEDEEIRNISSSEGSISSNSAMMSGIQTVSTTDLTVTGDALSIRSAESSQIPEYGDHGAVSTFSPGIFAQIFREHFQQPLSQVPVDDNSSGFGGTIISSSPSECNLEAPPMESNWSVPSVLHSNYHDTVSIATTDSFYQDVELKPIDGNVLHSSYADDRSLATSSSPITVPLSSKECDHQSSENKHTLDYDFTERHHSSSFIRVAERLSAQIPREDENDSWYSRFTENDWVSFCQEANMVLSAINNEDEDSQLLLPPSPPSSWKDLPQNSTPYVAADVLPSTFICLICSDVVVGATLLDCGCSHSAICTACWEDRRTISADDDGELEDLVHVKHNKSCPFCGKKILHANPCHVLDIAILHCTKALPLNHPVQVAYYRRLALWRLEVQRRRFEFQLDAQRQRELLIAEIIQEEENLIWNKEKPKSFWQANKHFFVAIAEIALVAAVAVFARGRILKMSRS